MSGAGSGVNLELGLCAGAYPKGPGHGNVSSRINLTVRKKMVWWRAAAGSPLVKVTYT